MIFLLDTNAFSDLANEHSNVLAHMANLPLTDRGIICSIVRGEVRYGIERLPQGRRRRELEAKTAEIFAALTCEPVPEAAGDYYARIKSVSQRQGRSLSENDLWIAATALALDAVLVTRDSDFRQVEGLNIQDWTA